MVGGKSFQNGFPGIEARISGEFLGGLERFDLAGQRPLTQEKDRDPVFAAFANPIGAGLDLLRFGFEIPMPVRVEDEARFSEFPSEEFFGICVRHFLNVIMNHDHGMDAA